MVRFLVHRPIAVLVSFFAVLLLGATAYTFLPTSLLPDTDVPQITVRLEADNMSAQEIEQQLTAPIRSGLLQLHGLARIESRSMEGAGMIRLDFEHGTHTGIRFIEVNEKVDLAMNRLPRSAPRPQVVKTGVDDIPIFQLNVLPRADSVSRQRMAEISSLAREVIRRRIEQLPQVAMADITGLTEPEVRVIPDRAALQSLGLEANVLQRAFTENKLNLGNIQVRDGHYQYFLQLSSEVQSLEALAATPLNIQGRLFRLGELATLALTHADETGGFYSNGRRGINFSIIKQSDAKVKDLQQNFEDLLQRLRLEYADLDFELHQDQTELLDFAINNLWQDLWLGGILAFLLMLIFVRRIRPALLIGITMPLSLVISQLGFYLFGISINIISLGGLILGLSMIIDNSIVVIDTINRQREAGLSITEAAIQGTNEIIRPLITSVLTNCAVFIPLIFMSGLAGAIFFDQALSITIGVVASLIVAIILLPPLYSLVYRRRTGQPGRVGGKSFEFRARVHITGWYERGLDWVFRLPRLTFLLVALLLGLGVWVYLSIDKRRLPVLTAHDAELYIDWNEALDVAENQHRVQQLIHAARAAGITQTNTWVGEQQYLLERADVLDRNQAKIYIKSDEALDLDRLRQELQAVAAEIFPGATLDFYPARNAFDEVFGDHTPPLYLQVKHVENRALPPVDVITQLLDSVQRRLLGVRVNPIALNDKLLLTINAAKAARYGIGLNEVSARIGSALQPTFVDYYQGAQELVPIVIPARVPGSVRDMLGNTFIHKGEQVQIPLSALVDIDYDHSYRYINASKQGVYYPLSIHTEQPRRDLRQLEQLFAEDFESLEVVYGGSYFDNRALIGEMSVILLVSVLLLYFILAAQFESLVQPLFILAELPVAIAGALLFLHLAGSSINLMSLIGIVIMCGLVINDSILKIDAINQLRARGVRLMPAIYAGGHKRLKPMVMITLTSIGALAPTLFMSDMGSELQRPLALALIGGMVVGLIVSLFFVPLLYWLVYRRGALADQSDTDVAVGEEKLSFH